MWRPSAAGYVRALTTLSTSARVGGLAPTRLQLMPAATAPNQSICLSCSWLSAPMRSGDSASWSLSQVMMAAIKTDVVDKHVQVVEACKRSVEVVDVCCIAAYNWLKHTGEFGDQGECVALIDMGAATTDIVIEREGRFRFTRPLNFGGNDVTRAIAAAFSVNFQDAERMKRESRQYEEIVRRFGIKAS